MQIVIADILKADDLDASIRAALAQARVSSTAAKPRALRRGIVKDNRQADARDKSLDAARSLVAARIMENDLFRIAARPKMLSPLLFSRYGTGMQYGSACRRRADGRHAHRPCLHAVSR